MDGALRGAEVVWSAGRREGAHNSKLSVSEGLKKRPKLTFAVHGGEIVPDKRSTANIFGISLVAGSIHSNSVL